MSATLEAVTDCPSCLAIDVHYLHRPRVCLIHPERGHQEVTEIRHYGMSKVTRSIMHPPPGWYDEAPYGCIRACRTCGHEWGQD